MVTAADSAAVLALDAAPADDASRAGWQRAAVCAALASTLSLAVMVACATLVRRQPGLGDALLAVFTAVLALAGVALSNRPAGPAALRVGAAIAIVAGAVGIFDQDDTGSELASPMIAFACVLAGGTLWFFRRSAAWRLSDTLLATGAAVAVASIVASTDPLNDIVRLGTHYPAMRPLSAWVALAIGAALWASHQRFRRLGWLLLAAAAVPLASTLLGKVGMPTPSAWLWGLGLLPTRDAPVIGMYTDGALCVATIAVALRLRDPRREHGHATAVSRGLGVAIASVSGMAVIGLLASIETTTPSAAGANISLGASVVLFSLGAAIAVDRDGGLRDELLDALPLAVSLTLGGLFWWGTTSDRDVFERRAATSELVQVEALLHQDLSHRVASVGRLGHFVDALDGPGSRDRFVRQVDDIAKDVTDLVHVHAYLRDGTALEWGPAPSHGPTRAHGRIRVPEVETVPGGWWITVPGETGTAAFVDLTQLVQRRLAAGDGAPMRLQGATAPSSAPPAPAAAAVASRRFELAGHAVSIEVLPDARLRGFVLSHTAVVGAVSVGLLVSFVLFLLELARSRAHALVLESQRRLDASEELARVAGVDGVTGLTRFSARSTALSTMFDGATPQGWLILIDLDAFGSLNDALGHEAGDEILRLLAARVAAHARGAGELLRFGGEGFALIGTDAADIDALRQLAERIRQSIGEPVELASPAQQVKVTASIGVARMPEHGTRLQALLRNADLARLSAKRAGRNQTQVARVVDADVQRDRLAMTAALRDAIAHDGIRVAFQPIVDVDLGRITGFEALARWHHPQWGDVPPTQFIPLAESSGLMERLGEVVMRTACAQLRQWQSLGYPALSISVNVSPSQLGQGTLSTLVAECVRVHGLDSGTVTLEVTESMLIEDVFATASLLEELKRLGVRLALDDFGTGYSSLAYLQRLPLDVLKIDRSFVRNVVGSANDAAIIRMIMALSGQMRLQTVAEGVEDDAQQACLRSMGCTRMQGYRFARPCFAEDATTLLLAFNGMK